MWMTLFCFWEADRKFALTGKKCVCLDLDHQMINHWNEHQNQHFINILTKI